MKKLANILEPNAKSPKGRRTGIRYRDPPIPKPPVKTKVEQKQDLLDTINLRQELEKEVDNSELQVDYLVKEKTRDTLRKEILKHSMCQTSMRFVSKQPLEDLVQEFKTKKNELNRKKDMMRDFAVDFDKVKNEKN